MPDAKTSLIRISRARFDAFVGFCRSPFVRTLAREFAWFETPDGELFAALVHDRDDEFSGILFARDLRGRFRWINQTTYFDAAHQAQIALQQLVARVQPALTRERMQGDESSAQVDFFKHTVREGRLHPRFKILADDENHAAAKELIEVMMRWHENTDGNFIQQFQSDGFDARVWELYLWATLVSLDLAVAFPQPGPDFLARGLGGAVAIEATTINPSVQDGRPVEPPRPTTPAEVANYFRNYLPIRYASALTTKLSKKYWEHPDVQDVPFAIAVQDFHDEMAMTYSGRALPSYLYGLDLLPPEDETDKHPSPITAHDWAGKRVQSGFFSLPESNQVGAVIINRAGTIAKFNRMGLKVGFRMPDVHVIHVGSRLKAVDGEAGFAPFSEEVGEHYREEWVDGMDVFHNPNALHPLDPLTLPGAAHHRLVDGGLESMLAEGYLMESTSLLVTGRPEGA